MLTLTDISYTSPVHARTTGPHLSNKDGPPVLGDNGLGKTTLLNIAIGNVAR